MSPGEKAVCITAASLFGALILLTVVWTWPVDRGECLESSEHMWRIPWTGRMAGHAYRPITECDRWERPDGASAVNEKPE